MIKSFNLERFLWKFSIPFPLELGALRKYVNPGFREDDLKGGVVWFVRGDLRLLAVFSAPHQKREAQGLRNPADQAGLQAFFREGRKRDKMVSLGRAGGTVFFFSEQQDGVVILCQ
jgi:hypothetical protein